MCCILFCFSLLTITFASEANCARKHVCLVLLFNPYNAGLYFHTRGLTVQCPVTSIPCPPFTQRAKIDNYTFGNHQGLNKFNLQPLNAFYDRKTKWISSRNKMSTTAQTGGQRVEIRTHVVSNLWLVKVFKSATSLFSSTASQSVSVLWKTKARPTCVHC